MLAAAVFETAISCQYGDIEDMKGKPEGQKGFPSFDTRTSLDASKL